MEETKETKKKIQHNKAVAEFYRGGLKEYVKFRKSLDDIIGETPNTNIDAFDLKDLSLVVALFNQAVIAYQLRQSLSAWKIIHVLLKHMDAFDTTVAQKIGLLAIHLMLNLNQPRKAEAIITLLKIRLSTTDLLCGSDDEEEGDLLLEKNIEKTKTVKCLDEFRWMCRLYKMRSKILNGKIIVVPNEEVK